MGLQATNANGRMPWTTTGQLKRKGTGFSIVEWVSLRRRHLSRNLDKVRKGSRQILIKLYAFPSCLLRGVCSYRCLHSVMIYATFFPTSTQIRINTFHPEDENIYFWPDIPSKNHPTSFIYFPLQPKPSKQLSIIKVFFSSICPWTHIKMALSSTTEGDSTWVINNLDIAKVSSQSASFNCIQILGFFFSPSWLWAHHSLSRKGYPSQFSWPVPSHLADLEHWSASGLSSRTFPSLSTLTMSHPGHAFK